MTRCPKCSITKETVTAEQIVALIEAERNEEQREVLMRFFQTGKGQYAEGDQFLGLKVPQTRSIVKEARNLVPDNEIEKLVNSPWHEVRLCGFLLLVEEMKAAMPKKRDTADILERKRIRRREIAKLYLRNARKANNWDLVDLSCEYVLGPYLQLEGLEDSDILTDLSRSDNLWEQRISIVTTLHFIRNGNYQPTIRIADTLLEHPHHLIKKATGWMLREIGKRNRELLLDYLETRRERISAITRSYATEHIRSGK